MSTLRGKCPDRVKTKGERHQVKMAPKPARTEIAGIPYRRCYDDTCLTGCEPNSFYCKKHVNSLE